MSANATTYTTSDGKSLTADALKAAPEETQVDVMETWFFTYYEDPAQHTPHDSSEGGYQYIYGGPFEASDALHDEFGDIVPEAVIDGLLLKLAGLGHEWAPTSEHPEYLA